MESLEIMFTEHALNGALFQLDHLLRTNESRARRNIIGDVLSSITGLVTKDQLAHENEQISELKKRVKHTFDIEIELEKLLLNTTRNTITKDEFIEQFHQLKYRILQAEQYFTRKVTNIHTTY
jgi:hypothetical protein